LAQPRFFSAPHPDAVGSLFDPFVVDACRLLRLELFPWQEMVLRRALEVDGSGRLCWRHVVVSVSRQSGKSVGLLRPLAVARWLMGARWGVPQTMLQVARKRDAASKLMVRPDAVRLAEGFGVAAKRGNGFESWEFPDGSLWRVESKSGAYGETTHLLICDETWDIGADDFWSSLFPTTTEAENSQVWMVSAANAKAGPLMVSRREAGIDPLKDDVMIADWGAGSDDDPFDLRTWWRSSPRWTPDRFDTLRDALDGGRASFMAEFLNVWPVSASGRQVEWPVGFADAPSCERGGAEVVVVEHGAEGAYGVVAGRREGQGVALWGERVGSLESAVELAGRWADGGVAVVAGLSVASSFPGCEKVGTRETKQHSSVFAEAVVSGRVAHDHSDVMQESRDAVAMPVDGHLVLSASRSRGPVPVLKGMLWAHMWLSRPQEVALIV
jgi:hypothetical protein